MAIEYFLVLGAMLFVPFVVSFHPRLSLYKHKRGLLFALLTPSILYGLWDVAATDRGHWTFNPQYVIGVEILALPIEEWFFFVVLAFVSVFTWEAVNTLLRGGK